MEECRHYSHTIDEDTKTDYCKDCNVILSETKYWGATVNIGSMEHYFTLDSNSIDMSEIIEYCLGVKVEVNDVRFMYNADSYSWDVPIMFVTFSVGKANMYATIRQLRCSSKYTPTERFFTPKSEEAAN